MANARSSSVGLASAKARICEVLGGMTAIPIRLFLHFVPLLFYAPFFQKVQPEGGQMSAMNPATQSVGVVPEPKLAAKLIVLCAFDRDEEGTLRPVFDPREMPDERRAISLARHISLRHAGVITWSRTVDKKLGDYGPSEVLFQSGEVPDLE